MNLLIMGAPGSGKGTQSEIIAEALNIPAISTGAILRKAVADGSELGNTAAKYINDGNLVPDDVVIKLVLERLSCDDCKNGYILDGFPRTLAQTKALIEAGISIDKVLMIHVPDEHIMERLTSRRVCTGCSMTYNMKYMPPAKEMQCDLCGEALTVREDDAPNVVTDRLAIYHQTTAPAIEYFNQLGKLVIVEGSKNVDNTTRYVFAALGIKND